MICQFQRPNDLNRKQLGVLKNGFNLNYGLFFYFCIEQILNVVNTTDELLLDLMVEIYEKQLFT